jgi:crossover junction endodeoxyribonuclease RuvC
MLTRLLQINEAPDSLDATDALAVAVCHFFQQGAVQSEKRYSGWKAFLSDNPQRKV